jgi:C-terminal processing protease CtpA/Prc
MKSIELVAIACLFAGCSLMRSSLPTTPPPLLDLEEPLELAGEPDDEAARRALEPGSFTGIEVSDARRSLDELIGAGEGVLVAGVVENSPGDIAGVAVGDSIVEVRVAGAVRSVDFPSEWRALEMETAPGSAMTLVVDRAGVELTLELTCVPRVRPAQRSEVERFREEDKVGFVLRTATEVEARAAGLAPGAGAVVVGLSRASPWRDAGLQYGDLIVSVDGRVVAHPALVLDAVRAAEPGQKLRLRVARAGATFDVDARVAQREHEMQSHGLFPVWSWERERERSTTSVLLGLVRYEHTPSAWRLRLLWLLSFGGGDSDRLEVER